MIWLLILNGKELLKKINDKSYENIFILINIAMIIYLCYDV